MLYIDFKKEKVQVKLSIGMFLYLYIGTLRHAAHENGEYDKWVKINISLSSSYKLHVL